MSLMPIFTAISEVASLVPKFDEKKKAKVDKETSKLRELEEDFQKAALEFSLNSFSDELLGLADAVKSQEKKVEDLWVIYAKELKG